MLGCCGDTRRCRYIVNEGNVHKTDKVSVKAESYRLGLEYRKSSQKEGHKNSNF